LEGFSIDITIDAGGVRAVRVQGKDWGQSACAYALLGRLSPLIQQLDATAKEQDLGAYSFDSGKAVKQ
jgi:hypothetical protein